MQTANDILLLENHLDFWEHLTDSQQEYLISNTKSVHYSAGEFLHYADSDCLGLLLIKSGQIRTFLLSEEGREITLYRREKKDIGLHNSVYPVITGFLTFAILPP